MTEFNDWEAWAQAAQEYRSAFGENPPTMELPFDTAEAMAAIQAAVAAGKPYRANVPEGADI